MAVSSSIGSNIFDVLVGLPLPEAAKADERVALEALKTAAMGSSVLLVLDDVWQAAHSLELALGAAARLGSVLGREEPRNP